MSIENVLGKHRFYHTVFKMNLSVVQKNSYLQKDSNILYPIYGSSSYLAESVKHKQKMEKAVGMLYAKNAESAELEHSFSVVLLQRRWALYKYID